MFIAGRHVQRGDRAGRQVQRRRELAELPRVLPEEQPRLAPVPPEVWNDVEARLEAHLRGFLFGVERTTKTAQSLMQKALAWAKKHEQHLGRFQHEAEMRAVATRAVVKAMVPDNHEMSLVDLYGDVGRMASIAVANHAAKEMTDLRKLHRRWPYYVMIFIIVLATLLYCHNVIEPPAHFAICTLNVIGLLWRIHKRPRYELRKNW